MMSCRFLVVATGLFGNPLWPGIEGLTPGSTNVEARVVMHARNWPGPGAFVGKRILIIGAGISGVSIAEESARAGLRVMVSRRPGGRRLVPPRVLGLDILHWFRPAELLPRAFFGRLCQDGVHPPAYDNGYRPFVAIRKIT